MENSPSSLEKNRSISSPQDLDFLSMIRPYLQFWPLYLLVVVVCLILMGFYIAMKRPLYPVEASILFLENKDSKSSMVDKMDIDFTGLNFNSVNVENELLLIKSREILYKAIEESNTFVDYSTPKGLRRAVWYRELPYTFSFPHDSIDKIRESYNFEVKDLGGRYVITLDNEEERIINVPSLPFSFVTKLGTVVMLKNEYFIPQQEYPEHVDVKVYSPLSMAMSMTKQLQVRKVDKQASVAILSYTCDHRQKGEAFLTKLVEVYNRERAIDKNITAQKTYDFINERINLIGKELGETERKLESIKREQGVIDLKDLGLAVMASKEAEKLRMSLETESHLMDYLLNFLKDNRKVYELIPGTVSIKSQNSNDQALSATLQAHNALILERNAILKKAGSNHPRLLSLNSEIEQSRQNIRSAVEVVRDGLKIQLKEIALQEKMYDKTVAQAPTFERISVDVERQRAIRSELYLMLLTRREQTSIELAASVESVRIVDTPLASGVPASPKKQVLYLVAVIVGLVLTTLSLFLIRLLRVKFSTIEELKKLTSLPILAQIPKIKSFNGQGEIMVKLKGSSMMTEVYRSLRTNINFVSPNVKCPIIMVTSTIAGEGKTFVASNLAVSLSALEKKVLIIGLDLRNPKLHRAFGEMDKEVIKQGISMLLADSSLNPEDYIVQLPDYPFLSILHAGKTPPNPPELLSRPRFRELIERFREEFDYVILDVAPVGPVVDSFTVAQVADVTLYVSRANYTNRRDLDYIHYLVEHQKLSNVNLIFNGVSESNSILRSKYGYGYGYGKELKEE